MRKVYIGFMAVLAAAYVGRAQTRGGGLDQAAVQELLTKFNVPGVSIADAETKAPVTPDTMFQAASISKPVAAMVSLKAVQDKRFALDQDINTILKSWKLPDTEFSKDRPVTPRMLMSHTSGMGDGFGFPGYSPNTPLPTLTKMMDGLPPAIWAST